MHFALFLGLFAIADAWNTHCHKTVARVAANAMAKKTRRFIHSHLENRPDDSIRLAELALIRHASWADWAARNGFGWSAEFHFAHTPYRHCEPFDIERDCPNDRCIVTAIGNYTSRAADFSLSQADRSEAIKMLVHLVADIHQPLHLGFAIDKGGNRISLTFPEDHSLHEVWDSHLMSRLKKGESWFLTATEMVDELDDSVRDAARLELDPIVPGNPMSGSRFATLVASETIMSSTCSKAYSNELGLWIEPDTALSEAYLSDRTEHVRDRLLQAGVRLAQLFDAIAETYYAAEHAAERVRWSAAEETEVSKFPMGFAMDVEEVVFDPANEIGDEDIKPDWTVSEFDDEEIGTEALTTVAPSTAAMEMSTISVDEFEKSAVSSAKKRRNMKKKLRKAIKKRSVDGIDIETLVLIKRDGKFFITAARRLDAMDPKQAASWYPGHVQVAQVSFSGSEEGTLFFFDANVFVKELSSGLIEAVFKKLAGVEDYTGTVATVVPTGPAGALRSVLVKGGEMPREGAELLELLNAQLEGDSGSLMDLIDGMCPVKGVFGTTTVESITEFLKRYPTKESLVAGYGTAAVDPEQVWLDVLKSQSSNIVVHDMLNFWVVSREDFLTARKNSQRWVFNKFQIVNRKGLGTEPVFPVYIDARVMDFPPTKEILEELDAIRATPAHARRVANALKGPSSILHLLHKYKLMRRNPVLRVAISIEFERVNTVSSRPWETIEFVIRNSRDRDRLVAEFKDAV